MKKQNSYILFFLIFLLNFTSCSNVKISRLNNLYSYTPSLSLKGKIKAISIIDKREQVEDRNLKIPKFTFPGNNDKVSPSLTIEHKELIDSLVRSYSIQNGEDLEVLVVLKKGEKEIKTNTFSEEEKVNMILNMTINNLTTLSKSTSVATINLFISSNDASNKFLDIMYIKAIHMSINKCMDQHNQNLIQNK